MSMRVLSHFLHRQLISILTHKYTKGSLNLTKNVLNYNNLKPAKLPKFKQLDAKE